jgi:hypothetical protein
MQIDIIQKFFLKFFIIKTAYLFLIFSCILRGPSEVTDTEGKLRKITNKGNIECICLLHTIHNHEKSIKH